MVKCESMDHAAEVMASATNASASPDAIGGTRSFRLPDQMA
jgi:hypothetical protein